MAPMLWHTVLSLLVGVGFTAVAEVPDSPSCLYFSTDPDDRSGPPIRFRADLWDGPQRAPTSSNGKGEAEFILERDTLKLSWTVTFSDLTSPPTDVHVHGPVPAEGTAPVMFSIAPKGFKQPITGERIISLGEAAFFVRNSVYVNLHTVRYPEGEIRGTLKKQRPQC